MRILRNFLSFAVPRPDRSPPDARPLNILITQRALQSFAGTEMVTAEFSRALTQRGHRVAVYCPQPGKIANIITSCGATVHDRLEDVPFSPDIIHGQHHLPAMAALMRFPDSPAIHVWHGTRPWVERVPRHANIGTYVVISAGMVPRLAADYQIDPARITVIENAVDTLRYSQVKQVPDRPRSALLYGQHGFYDHELRLLEQACAENDLSLDKIGNAYGNPRPRPEYFLPDYDIVFAIGRSALEAMACGCAVLPIVPQLAGTRIRAESLGDWSAINFSPRYFTSASRFDADWLRAECANWDKDDIALVTQTVRRDFTLSTAMDRYEQLYRQVISTHRPTHAAADAARHMEWLATDVDQMWSSSEAATRELEKLRSETAKLREELRQSEARTRFTMEQLLHQMGVGLPQLNGDAQAPDLRPALASSGLFDPDWYLATYTDAAETGLDPLEHYLRIGASRGYEPSKDFDSAAYLDANPHLRGLGISPLEHYIRQLSLVAPCAGRDVATG